MVPISTLTNHLMVYQNRSTGEVLVLFDYDLNMIDKLMQSENESWWKLMLSEKQYPYFQACNISISSSTQNFISDNLDCSDTLFEEPECSTALIPLHTSNFPGNKTSSNDSNPNTLKTRLRTGVESIADYRQNLMSKLVSSAVHLYDKRVDFIDKCIRLVDRILQLDTVEVNEKNSSLYQDIDTLLIHCDSQLSYDFNDMINEKLLYQEICTSARGLLEQCSVLVDSCWQTSQFPSTEAHNATEYSFLNLLGEGSFAKVFLAHQIDDDSLCAIKVMSKKFTIHSQAVEKIINERKVMSKMNSHPEMFVSLFRSFSCGDLLFLVTEYVEGGDCMKLINSNVWLSETVVQHIIAETSMAIRHLHTHGIVHRDIKPDNLLLTLTGHVKLTDFGSAALIQPPKDVRKPSSDVNSKSSDGATPSSAMSVDFQEPARLFTIVGSYYYVAPEMILGAGYDHAVDWWAVGVLCFHLFCRVTPFEVIGSCNDMEATMENIVMGDVNWSCLPSTATPSVRSLISELLVPQPCERLGHSRPVLLHPFFRSVDLSNIYNGLGPFIPKSYKPTVFCSNNINDISFEENASSKGLGSPTPDFSTLLNPNVDQLFEEFSFN